MSFRLQPVAGFPHMYVQRLVLLPLVTQRLQSILGRCSWAARMCFFKTDSAELSEPSYSTSTRTGRLGPLQRPHQCVGTHVMRQHRMLGQSAAPPYITAVNNALLALRRSDMCAPGHHPLWPQPQRAWRLFGLRRHPTLSNLHPRRPAIRQVP